MGQIDSPPQKKLPSKSPALLGLNVKLSNSQINKLKSEIKSGTKSFIKCYL